MPASHSVKFLAKDLPQLRSSIPTRSPLGNRSIDQVSEDSVVDAANPLSLEESIGSPAPQRRVDLDLPLPVQALATSKDISQPESGSSPNLPHTNTVNTCAPAQRSFIPTRSLLGSRGTDQVVEDSAIDATVPLSVEESISSPAPQRRVDPPLPVQALATSKDISQSHTSTVSACTPAHPDPIPSGNIQAQEGPGQVDGEVTPPAPLGTAVPQLQGGRNSLAPRSKLPVKASGQALPPSSNVHNSPPQPNSTSRSQGRSSTTNDPKKSDSPGRVPLGSALRLTVNEPTAPATTDSDVTLRPVADSSEASNAQKAPLESAPAPTVEAVPQPPSAEWVGELLDGQRFQALLVLIIFLSIFPPVYIRFTASVTFIFYSILKSI